MNSVPRTKINDDDDDPGDLRGFHDRNNSYSTSSSGTQLVLKDKSIII